MKFEIIHRLKFLVTELDTWRMWGFAVFVGLFHEKIPLEPEFLKGFQKKLDFSWTRRESNSRPNKPKM